MVESNIIIIVNTFFCRISLHKLEYNIILLSAMFYFYRPTNCIILNYIFIQNIPVSLIKNVFLYWLTYLMFCFLTLAYEEDATGFGWLVCLLNNLTVYSINSVGSIKRVV